jgi:hypothetical protein
LKSKKKENTAGKGDAPRNCASENFKKNYDEIDWGNKKSLANRKQK